jgi:bacterioferritin-associated ferredoxin
MSCLAEFWPSRACRPGNNGSRLVCACLGVTEEEIVAAIQGGRAATLRELILLTQAGTGCTACRARLAQYLAAPRPSPTGPECPAA